MNISAKKIFEPAVVILVVLFCYSCRKSLNQIEKPEDYQPYSYSQIFEAFWKGMSNNYVFWDIDNKNVDWDADYKKYKPLFEELNIDNYEDVLTGVDYIKDMTRKFTDGHMNITFNDSRLAGFFINPAKQRKIIKDFSQNVSIAQQLYQNPGIYFDKPYYRNTGSLNILCGTIQSSILYLSLDKFILKTSYLNSENDSIKNAFNYFLYKLGDKNITKLIIDLRGNRGGDVADLDFLVGQLTTNKLRFGTLKYKAGPNGLDYTPAINAEVQPQQGAQNFNGSIRVLTDGLSESMAEICAMSLRAFPSSLVIGDTTWGATGLIPGNYNNQLYGGGPFVAAKFINVYTPAAKFIYKDGNSYEGVGFPPDVRILNKTIGRDDQLEKAIESLSEK